jgi:hypothetical protein
MLKGQRAEVLQTITKTICSCNRSRAILSRSSNRCSGRGICLKRGTEQGASF